MIDFISPLRRFLSRRLPLVAGLLVGAACLPFLGRWLWWCELASHFRVQFAVAATLVTTLALMLRLWRTVLTAAAVLTLQLAFIIPLYLGGPGGAPPAEFVRVVSLNLFSGNRDIAAVRQFLEECHPDVVVLEEFTPRWAAELGVLLEDYPHRILEARQGNFGIALLSRYPIVSQRPEWSLREIPTVVARLALPGGEATVVGVHTFPPIGPSGSQRRNLLLGELGALTAATEGPVLLLGDLNCTSWSPHFQTLLREGRLSDSRRGFGVQPTWPAQRWWLRIPIDHCLVSRECSVYRHRVGPDLGSDHLPIVVDLTIRF
jgi:endonuclease/exonuclease/phosphatase (EEP) superfamily protein YafD